MADDEDDGWSFETEAVETDTSDSGQSAEADSEWRYSLSDLDDEDEPGEQSAIGGNVFGSFSSDSEVIEAGSPSIEGTLFVVAGAVLALLFFLQFYLLMG